MVSEQLRDLDVQFGKECNRGLIGWRDYERRRGTGLNPLDFVLVQEPGEYFYSREDVRRHFRKIADDIHRDTSDGVFLGAKADAIDAYLDYLIDPRSFSYAEGLRKIAGFKLRLIPGTEVEAARGLVVREFNDKYELPYTRDGWERFFSKHGITPEQAIEQIKGSDRNLVSQVVRVVGARSQPKTNFQAVDEPEYYIGWVSANRDDLKGQVVCEFKVNKNPVNRNRFYKGVPSKVVYHEEGAHAVQAQSFADNIDEGIVNRGRGIITVPGLEQWILEGWACEITRLFPSVLDPLSPDLREAIKFAVELDYLTNIAYNNALYNMYSLDMNRTKVAKDLEELLPHESSARIDLMLTSMTRKPERMFYLPVYGDATFHLRDTVEKELSGSELLAFTEEIHRQPMIPDQVKLLVQKLSHTKAPSLVQ